MEISILEMIKIKFTFVFKYQISFFFCQKLQVIRICSIRWSFCDHSIKHIYDLYSEKRQNEQNESFCPNLYLEKDKMNKMNHFVPYRFLEKRQNDKVSFSTPVVNSSLVFTLNLVYSFY